MEAERWRQIEKLYHAALELAGSKRAAFLDQACAADHDLRREVDSLLASDAAAGSFIEAPAVAMAAKGLARSPSLLGMGKDRVKTGVRISHYLILQKLGSGGMGEVYRARDTKLERDIALKILPQQFAADPERLARFQREARAVAALNHPNIVTIHSVEEADGVHFLTMELVDGQSLDRLIPASGLPFERIVEIASAMTEALAAAHEKGIVHRDLKPANVMLTGDGRVKVLDFGLAKETRAPGGHDATQSAAGPTQAGVVMGTPAYMSPEQARGEELDARTDLFSFGAVLYEMATGRQAFSGTTAAVIHDAILNREPLPLHSLNPGLPPRFEEIINKALEKDRHVRYQHASDILADLKRLKRDTSSGVGAGLVPGRTQSGIMPGVQGRPQGAPLRRWLLGSAGAVIVTAAVIGYLLTRPFPLPKVSNYVQLTHDGEPKMLVGTDGSRLYFRLGDRTRWSIDQVSVSGGEPARIETPSGRMYPASVSPDGSDLLVSEWQAEIGKGPLWSLPVLGGSARRLGDAVGGDGAWSPDGKTLVYSNGSDLFLAKNDGSDFHKLVSVAGWASAPEWSPDGSELRFTVGDPQTSSRSLWQVSAQGANLHPLLTGSHHLGNVCCGRWTSDGRYFIFESRGQIWALPEIGGLLRKPSRTPIQLTSSPLRLGSPLPAKDGKKLFVVGRTSRGELVRYDAKSGQFLPFLSGISAEYVAFSKDRQSVAYVTYPEGTLWRSKPDGSERVQLSYPPIYPVMPRWSPDGKQIVFYHFTPGKPQQLYTVSPEGGNAEQLMPNDPKPQVDPDWSPDGTKIVFAGAWGETDSTIRVLNLKNHRVSILPGSQGLISPRWSPDGRYIVATPLYSSGLVLFDFQTEKWSELLKLVGTAFENWSADGRYVYFIHGPDNPGAYRLRISDHKVERVADLKDLPITGYMGFWLGLTPDGSPLVLRDAGSQDIYALDWEAP
ncbi:MAG TPA: protein kinase [Terriglobia bacterium]|nr:protein kinase [Terriglobia bacterium]